MTNYLIALAILHGMALALCTLTAVMAIAVLADFLRR